MSGQIGEVKHKEDDELKCPVCGSTHLVVNTNGELVCDDCGAVVSEGAPDLGREWRAYSSEEWERRSRTGEPVRLGATAGSFATVIDKRDISRLKISAEGKKQMYGLNLLQTRNRLSTSHERSIARAEVLFERIASALKLPENVKEEAYNIYRRAGELGVVRGRTIESMVAAAVYAAARSAGLPLELKSLSEYTGRQNRRTLAKDYRLLVEKLGLRMGAPDPAVYVPKITSKLGLSKDVHDLAIGLVNEAKKHGLTAGKDPSGLAAAAVYLATLQGKEKRTQRQVAQAAEVTEVTVRTRYRELADALNAKHQANGEAH
ncbi:MAG: TFIIB-type zinc ribbon-containing protein [Thermoprotei archaeon]